MSNVMPNDEFFDDKHIFPDYPVTGPLAKYRQNSSFDWKKLRVIIDDEDILKLRSKAWKFMETHPLFDRENQSLTLDEVRHLSLKRALVVFNEKMFTTEDSLRRLDLAAKFGGALTLVDPGMAAKIGLGFNTYSGVIRTLDSDGRLYKYIEENQRMETMGAFCLTEIGHGSNTKGMMTTATYDKESKSFIMNSESFEAAKAWAGNLGKTCTNAIVYAQLIVDGKKHGLNAFVVPIRDKKTLKPFPGVIVGDLGEKIGMNGIDNGFLMFQKYHIPRENLLSRTEDVTEDGVYVSKIKDKNERIGASFAVLSQTRVGIADVAGLFITKAITIAVRYGSARKQFGPEGSNEELPVIEYQAQQYRILPHLAVTYALRIFGNWLTRTQSDITMKLIMGENLGRDLGPEIHALSSACKSVCTWAARDCIQECREACGGHGYLKCAGLGDLRNDNDPSCTYEGENNVLLQQASNWLLNARSKGYDYFASCSPLETASFLKNFNHIIKSKFTFKTPEMALDPENILSTFNWIVAYLLEKTSKRIEALKSSGKSIFEVRNTSQIFNARNLAICYAQRCIFSSFYNVVKSLKNGPEKAVLTKLLSLYGAHLITLNYIGIMYEGGFVQNVNALEIYENGIMMLLPVISQDAVSLVDSITFPDFVINSTLGHSDGEIYKNLQATLFGSPGVFERPKWWQDFVHKESYLTPKHKL